ncbi:MAG TPA: hypothetical protein VN982_08495, partial [Candidatus Dormibacteraeota bacterium]|nr:hypothetical protein [Candidatus Dormibacteraeota bacterium]
MFNRDRMGWMRLRFFRFRGARAIGQLPGSQYAKCDGGCLSAIGHHRNWQEMFQFELICPEVDFKFPIRRAGSDGRCNTIWYKAVFKGGVYETRETIWAFGGAETRRVASLESRAD